MSAQIAGRAHEETGENRMIASDLLEILRCPVCVQSKPGLLQLKRDIWLVCEEPDCQRKYPIVDDIPVLLVEEGNRWISTPVEALPIPPPPLG
jgi:uncharacterized protein